MKYLKLINCPVRGLFPEKGGKIDWTGVGFDPAIVRRLAVQGTNGKGDHISLFPISDEAKLTASGIVGKVNNNEFPQDSAAVITQAQYEAAKDELH